MISRLDTNGKLMGFTLNYFNTINFDNIYAPWDFVHFRHKGDFYKSESEMMRYRAIRDRQLDKNLTSTYGQSLLRPAIKVYAQLRFVENMILLARLTNSIRRNIFLINVGDVAPDKAYETIQNYANLLKKDINMSVEDSMLSSSKHTTNYDEDIFIPVSDPLNDVRIEQVGGEVNIKEQYDLEYLLNKLFSSLKIPKAYLNYEQDLNARSTLIQLDVRYARSVAQLQNTIVAGLRRIINIHLSYLGLNPDDIEYNLYLTSVSSIEDENRFNQLQVQVGVARDIWDVLSTMKESLSNSDHPVNLETAAETIMKDYLKLDQSVIDSFLGRDTRKLDQKVIHPKRVYSGTDAHAMYPNDSNKKEFKKLSESIKMQLAESQEQIAEDQSQ